MNTKATIEQRDAAGIRLSRVLPANVPTVFRALSEREHLMRWWGPPNCRVVECSVDFRVGGVWHYRLASSDGTQHWSRAVYREIVPDARIVYAETGSDADGRVVHDRPASVGTLTLTPDPDGTRLDVRLVFVSPLDRDKAVANGVEAGFTAALHQLTELLSVED
ncbi:SRPBCC family protein [Rathayibacter sp. CAU 1779]